MARAPSKATDGRPSTRDRLLQSALDATDEGAFSNLSLRELTRRVGIVPTGFYRHFSDMNELGLTLVDEAFGTLQGMVRSVREDPIPPDDMIRGTVAVLAGAVKDRPTHFRFIAREQNGGSAVLREAIRERLTVFREDLANDLGRLPIVGEWGEPDRLMLADLMMKLMVAAAAEMLEHPEHLEDIVHRTEQQMRLVVLAVPGWKP